MRLLITTLLLLEMISVANASAQSGVPSGDASRWPLPPDNQFLADANADGLPDGAATSSGVVRLSNQWQYQGAAPPQSAFASREPGSPPALRLSAELGPASWTSPAIPLTTSGPFAIHWETLFEGPYHWTYRTKDCRVAAEFLNRVGEVMATTDRRLTCLRTLGWVPSWLRTPPVPDAAALRLTFSFDPGDVQSGTMWVRGISLEDLGQPLPLAPDQGLLTCRVVDENDQPLSARLYLRSQDGTPLHPPRSFYYDICAQPFHLPTEELASFEMALAPGDYSLLAMRGFEYEPASASVTIQPGVTNEITLRLRRAINLAALGWFSGDHHCHLHFHGSSRFANMTNDDLFRLAQAEGLNFLTIQGDEQEPLNYLDSPTDRLGEGRLRRAKAARLPARGGALPRVGDGPHRLSAAQTPHLAFGRHRARHSSAGLRLRLVTPDPSAFITYTSKFPSRPVLKRILLPSGDHSWLESSSGLLVRFVCPEPSAFITYISGFPSRCDPKAILPPSGDHSDASPSPVASVRFTRPVPSALMTHTPDLRRSFRVNAIFVPSGDQTGRMSSRRSLVTLVAPLPSAFIT